MEQVTTNKFGRNKRLDAGFTLVEMLVVLAIITIIMAFSVGSFARFSKSALLTRTGDHLVGMMAQAQQEAIADNSHVEVRFYQPRDKDDFIPKWSVVLVRENPDGTHDAVDTPYHFPDGIIMNRSAAISSLIGGLPERQDTENLITDSSSEPRTFTSFRFYSNGSTNLPVTANGDTWHLTVMDFKDGDGSESEPPPNFFTLRIDPFTGSVKTFRP